jgi:hypothetical protein
MTDEQPTEDVPDPPPWAQAPRPTPSRRRTAADAVADADFPLALRGYEREAVDRYVQEVSELVKELESARLRTTVVQRALDEVGEQTSEILRTAHETADEIAARSRAQAEGRLQRAEREAGEIRADAETTARLLESDNAELWRERSRLVEDIRALAQDVLAVADDALERLPPPEGLGESVESQGPPGNGAASGDAP